MKLSTRLSLVFAALLLPFGALALWVAERGAQNYFTEFTQLQNAPIAMYMAQRNELVRDGRLDREALARLAEHVMMINPSVEVYVLDMAGNVIGQASTANMPFRLRVALEPVKQFLSSWPEDTSALPLFGDDPMDRHVQRPFSAFPLSDGQQPIGYVYAVLGGRRHTSLLQSVRSSRSLQAVGWTLGAALVIAAIGGTIISFMLTRRLRRLTIRARQLQLGSESGQMASRPSMAELLPNRGADEIDALDHAYGVMSDHLQAQYRALERVERERRDLVASVSHDLRTPLTSMQGYLETIVMRRGHLEAAEELRFVETALRHSQRLERLIDDLFELSLLDSGERQIKPERFAIAELAQDALIDLKATAAEARIKLALNVPRGGNLEVYADIALVQRVLDNLLENALRFVEPDGRIHIAVHRLSVQWISITVSDDGAGMTKEACLQAANRGWVGSELRSDRHDDRAHAGLGLAIVRGIVNLHGGTLEFMSEIGNGTAVTFTLPDANFPT